MEGLVFACTLKPVLEWGEFYSMEGITTLIFAYRVSVKLRG